MSGKRNSAPTGLPEKFGGGSPVAVPTAKKNDTCPVFVDPSGHRVLATRLSAAALALAGVAFISGTGLLLSNQPSTTALADSWAANTVPRAAGAGPISGLGAGSLSGTLSEALSGQATPGVSRVVGPGITKYPVGSLLGGTLSAGAPGTVQGQPAPRTPPAAPAAAAAAPAGSPPAASPTVAAPPADPPLLVVDPPVVTPPVVTPPPEVAAEPPVPAPAEPETPVVPVVGPVVSTVGSLLGALL